MCYERVSLGHEDRITLTAEMEILRVYCGIGSRMEYWSVYLPESNWMELQEQKTPEFGQPPTNTRGRLEIKQQFYSSAKNQELNKVCELN